MNNIFIANHASCNISSSFGILMMIYSIYSIIADIAGEFIAIVAVLTSYRFHHLQNQFEFVTTALKDSWKTKDKLCKQIYTNKIHCGSFSIIKLIQENWYRYKTNNLTFLFKNFNPEAKIFARNA